MEIIKEMILQYLTEFNNFISAYELKKKLKIKGEEQTTSFFAVLDSMVEDGSLFFDEKKGYRILENELGYAFGEIKINKSGNGFVYTNEGYNIFIDKLDLNGALNGDRVLVDSIVYGKKDDFRGKVYKIVKRNTGNVLFEVVGNGYQASLVPCNPNETVLVSVNKNQFKKLVDGEIVLVKVGLEKVEDKYIGEIDKVVGHRNDAGIDLRLIYTKHDVPVEFSDEALREADNFPVEVSEDECFNRVDLRDKNIITIDCDSTKDRDDAVHVEKLANGNYKLYTSISHISYYVKKESSLYKEASTKGTSYYPNNTCNPMFPPKVSNGICSLNEDVDRLTRTCEMEFDFSGNLVDYNIYNSVINSKKAMSYSKVNSVLENECVAGYEEFVEQLKWMEELSDILEENRKNRNCVDFDIPDIEIVQDKDGKVEKIVESGNGKAGRIIENFMLVTNTTIAGHYSWVPFIYRVHEAPDVDVVKNVIKLLRISGFQIPKYSNIDEATLNDILNRVGSSEEAKIVRTVLLRSMKRARYDIINVGHFALQLENYSHFTSPIRRLADLRIHMLIDELETFDYSVEAIRALEEEMIKVAKHASTTERIAQDIENEALAMAMAEYMEGHIGEYFDGIVTEVYQYGMFVKTNNSIEGKVKIENILDDKYIYDDEKKALIGRKNKNRYQIGNKVCILVKDACKATRTINFSIDSGKVLKKVKNN